jgi:hypothetical protein
MSIPASTNTHLPVRTGMPNKVASNESVVKFVMVSSLRGGESCRAFTLERVFYAWRTRVGTAVRIVRPGSDGPHSLTGNQCDPAEFTHAVFGFFIRVKAMMTPTVARLPLTWKTRM